MSTESSKSGNVFYVKKIYYEQNDSFLELFGDEQDEAWELFSIDECMFAIENNFRESGSIECEYWIYENGKYSKTIIKENY